MLLTDQFTNLEGIRKGYIAQWTWQGFQQQSKLNFFSPPATPARKITLYRSQIKEKLQLNITETQI